MLRVAVVTNPAGKALVCSDDRCSWNELSALVDGLASGLAERGIAGGDRVLLLLDNRAEFVIALFAIARLGAIAVPVGVREQAPGLAYIAEQSGATAIMYEATLADRIPTLPLAIPVADGDPRMFVTSLAAPSRPLPQDERSEDDPALILYTSGTTGRPKGAIISHLALVHAGLAYADCMALTAGDRSVCVVPLSHITGITATLCAMTAVGGTMIVAQRFDALDFVALAVAERMTHALLVPAMYNLILARVDLAAHDLSAWRIGGFGGAPMPVPTIERLAQLLPTLELMNCYGATETCGGVTVMPARHLVRNSDSVGWPIAGASVVAMDERGREVPTGEAGELWIGGATVTPGYWNDQPASADNIVGGYWRSGDLGSVDAAGFVRVLDRLKDMVNRGGYKIFTAEVESVLMAHAAVLEAAVVGIVCDILGERVHAFVSVRADAGDGVEQSLRSHCRERLPDYKRPETYTIGVEALPRNLNGKIVKTQLRQQLAAAREATSSG